MYLQQNHLDKRTGKNNVFTTESSRSKNRQEQCIYNRIIYIKEQCIYNWII